MENSYQGEELAYKMTKYCKKPCILDISEVDYRKTFEKIEFLEIFLHSLYFIKGEIMKKCVLFRAISALALASSLLFAGCSDLSLAEEESAAASASEESGERAAISGISSF
ncbi:MAG: hypothetical protein IKO39_05855, partial [Treponema sp.]|nr:hypothetical protein [Treponema sp.]